VNKLFRLIADVGIKFGTRVRTIWTRIGTKNTAKIAAWASKNKGWLSSLGIATASATASAIVTRIVGSFIDAKESVAARWMESTSTTTPERASYYKRSRAISELRECVNVYQGYNDTDKDDNYVKTVLRMQELINLLVFNESDEEVRRIFVRAATVMPGCMEVGVVPEEGFSHPLISRTLRNLSEDALTAEDLEGAMDCVLDIAESDAPLKMI
jgi:hypothetical protein